MKLICTQEKFKKAILNLERVVSKQNTLPILNNILFEAERGGLKLSATNLEIGMVIKIGAKIEKEGKITIPARLIGNFISNLSITEGENIFLEGGEQGLKIKSRDSKTIIRGLSADDFPLIPQKKSDFLLGFPSFELKKSISKILTCVGLNETRQELTGVNIIFKEKEVCFAATDSFRLAESVLNIENSKINPKLYALFIKNKESVIVPSATFSELARVIQNENEVGVVNVAIENGQIFFDLNGLKIVSRLINGKYPEYQHIIPKDFKTKIKGDKEKIQSMIKMASVFSPGRTGEVSLKINAHEKKIVFESRSAEAGENSSELKLEVEGSSQEIIFNSKYLLDGINTLGTSQVALLANSGTTPVALKEIDSEKGNILGNYVYIVMPIKN